MCLYKVNGRDPYGGIVQDFEYPSMLVVNRTIDLQDAALVETVKSAWDFSVLFLNNYL